MTQQGWNTQGKIKTRNLLNCPRTDKFVHTDVSFRLAQILDGTCCVRPQAYNKRFQSNSPRNSDFRSIVVPDRFRTGLAPSVDHSLYVCTWQIRMMLKYTPRWFTLGFHLPEVHSRSLRELQIFTLVHRDFIVVVLLKSLDEPVSGFDELFVLCRSSCEPSDFASGHQLCTHFG